MDSRYVNIVESFGSDGLGTPSISIYFSYCDRGEFGLNFCKNCQNKELQIDGYGDYLTLDEIKKIVEYKILNMKKLFGECCIVFLGGEPTATINIEFVKQIAKHFNGIKKIMYTWKNKNMLYLNDIKDIDLIVCGEYLEELKVDGYLLATSNQYVINNKKEIIIKHRGEN